MINMAALLQMPVQPDWLVVHGVSPAHGSVRVPPRGGGDPVRLLPGGILRLLVTRLQRCGTSEVSRLFFSLSFFFFSIFLFAANRESRSLQNEKGGKKH